MPLPRLPRKKSAPADTSTTNEPPVTDNAPAPVPAAASGTPVKHRRRPKLWALGVALMVVGALGVWWIVESMSTTSQVVVAAADVPEGQVITAEDVTTSDVNVPSGAAVIPGGQLDTIVGQRATAPLEKGALLAPTQVNTDPLPAEGMAVVGVKVAPGQIPTQNVDPGDAIQILGTPKQGDDPAQGESPTVTGTIQAVGQPTTDGALVIDVLVTADQAGTLTALNATGRIGVVLVAEGA